MIEVKKLRAYLECPMPSVVMTPRLEKEEADEIEAELKDDMSEESKTMRKLSYGVKYMELDTEAGAFSCGECKYLAADGTTCLQIEVRAEVSATNGCCNRYEPARARLVFPPED